VMHQLAPQSRSASAGSHTDERPPHPSDLRASLGYVRPEKQTVEDQGRSAATAANTAAKPLDNACPEWTAVECPPSALIQRTILDDVPTPTDLKGAQLQGGAAAPDPAAYGLSPPLFQPLTALRGTRQDLPCTSAGRPRTPSQLVQCVPVSCPMRWSTGGHHGHSRATTRRRPSGVLQASSGRSAEGAGRRPRRAAPPPRTATFPTSSHPSTEGHRRRPPRYQRQIPRWQKTREWQ
jgi:hypothetical protein